MEIATRGRRLPVCLVANRSALTELPSCGGFVRLTAVGTTSRLGFLFAGSLGFQAAVGGRSAWRVRGWEHGRLRCQRCLSRRADESFACDHFLSESMLQDSA